MNRQLLCTLGKIDIPIIQEQPYFMVDLLRSNILLIGSAGSGKSNFLKVIITEMHRQLKDLDMNEQIFILDSADSLKDYQDFPFVAAHYDFSNEEYTKRVFYKIDKQYTKNVKALNGAQFYSENVSRTIPHTTLIIDNINSFLDIKYNEKYMEALIRLARDGQTRGISIILTGSSTKNITSMLNYFSQKIALNLSAEEYLNLFSKKAIGSKNVIGRGYGNITYDATSKGRTYPLNLPYELQIFLMNDLLSFSDQIKPERYSEKLTRFPLIIKESNYRKYLGNAENDDDDEYESNVNDVVVGVEYIKCKEVKTHFSISRVFAVYGKHNDEKPLLWKRLLKKFHDNKYEFIIIDDGRTKLKELKEEWEISDKNYISKRKSISAEDDSSKKIGLSVLLQFIDLIQTDFINLKGEKRSISSSQEILPAIMPPEYNRMITKNEGNTRKNCVFLLQSKEFFSNTIFANVFWGDIFPRLLTNSEDNNWYFFITDAQRIPNSDLQNHFNQYLDTAILLDDIAEFVSDRGRRTVFGDMDVKELKDRFGLCEENDAYYYQIDTAELWKIKCVWEDD